MPGLMRPGDKPAPAEEASVERAERMNWKTKRAYMNTLYSLENSRVRCLQYLADLNHADYSLERRVQDRLLGQLVEIKPSLRYTGPLDG